MGVTLERAGSVWAGGWCLGVGWGRGLAKRAGRPGRSPQSVARAGTHLLQPHAEAAEHLLHVAPLLHGDDSEVILLVYPHQEALVVVVPKVGCSGGHGISSGGPLLAPSQTHTHRQGAAGRGAGGGASLRRTAAHTCAPARTPRRAQILGTRTRGAQVCGQHSSTGSQNLSLTGPETRWINIGNPTSGLGAREPPHHMVTSQPGSARTMALPGLEMSDTRESQNLK